MISRKLILYHYLIRRGNVAYLRAGVDVAGYPLEPLVGAVDGDLGVAPDARALPRALGARQGEDCRRQQERPQGRRRRDHLGVLPSRERRSGRSISNRQHSCWQKMKDYVPFIAHWTTTAIAGKRVALHYILHATAPCPSH